MSKIAFTAYGIAKAAGSKRPFQTKTGKTVVVDANPKAKSWQYVVASAARDAYQGPLLSGALTVSFRFYFPRPKCHYGSGKNSGVLKASAPAFLTKAPDALKLARGVEDAMTKVVYYDDSQIIDEHLSKHYGEPARCEVTIQSLEVSDGQ